MKPISFKCSVEDSNLIDEIVERAVDLDRAWDSKYERLDVSMDITATHCNGCPLDLKKLLEADDFNFEHDVFGIRHHLNRETGQLEDFFLPRCALPGAA
jgi:hypothetical protein